MSFCPAYWDWLDKQANTKTVGSVDFIQQELIEGKDELSDWAKNRNNHFLSCEDVVTQNNFTTIVNFVMSHAVYSPYEKNRFLAKADPWLIAKAITINATVVTLESKAPKNSKKVKIPNICEEFSVDCITPYELLATFNPLFVLNIS